MSPEIIESSSSSSSLMPVTDRDVTTLKRQRQLLKKFIASQMKEANFKDQYAEDYGDGDYGTITGTKKKSLLKPGAEKLLKLFGLGCRFLPVDKMIDKEANFALFIYRAEVYHLRTGVVVSQCDASANSQEVKYKERTVWRKKKLANGKEIKESIKEDTPIFDVLNTLIKMAQKRAMVGATILATAASDFFTQDMEPSEDDEKPGATKEGPKDDGEAPICCDKPMMISKFPDKETGEIPWYCIKCKSKKFKSESEK